MESDELYHQLDFQLSQEKSDENRLNILPLLASRSTPQNTPFGALLRLTTQPPLRWKFSWLTYDALLSFCDAIYSLDQTVIPPLESGPIRSTTRPHSHLTHFGS
jgi:hypothetical protein